MRALAQAMASRLISSSDFPAIRFLNRSICSEVQPAWNFLKSPMLPAQSIDSIAASGVAYPAKVNGDVLAAAVERGIVTVAVPAAMIAIAPTTTAVFIFVHAISFNVVSRRVKVEVVTVVPLTAASVTDVASPIGAA